MGRVGYIVGAVLSLTLGTLTAAGCGSEGSTFGNGNGDGNGNGNGNGDGNGDQFADGGDNDDNTIVGNGDGGFNECASQNDAVVRPPVDLLFVIDVSLSMNTNVSPGKTKWAALKEAMAAFVNAPKSAGLSLSLRRFPRPNAQGDLCVSNWYRDNQLVALGELPGHASAITGGLDGLGNSSSFLTNTPTRPALEGVVAAAKTRQTANPDRSVNVVFLTDGVPTSCLSGSDNYNNGTLTATTTAIRTAAANGFAGPNSVRTFAVGLFTPGDTSSTGHAERGKAILDAMAQSGGTTSARIIDANESSVQAFIDAFNAIRSETISCTFPIPKPAEGEPDPNKVNVLYTPSGGTAQTLAFSASLEACDAANGGWYFSAGNPPNELTLCPVTCNALKNDPGAQIGVVQGCKTSTVQPPAPPK